MILNPAAGNGRAGRNRQAIIGLAEEILGEVRFEMTTATGAATALTRKALGQGYDTIIAVGGDGTVNEVVNGFFDNRAPVNPAAKLAVIPLGTGGDFAKTMQAPESLRQSLLNIKTQREQSCDVGYLECQTCDGMATKRYFLNIADAGFGGTLVQRLNSSAKALGPFFTYLTALVRTLSFYRNPRITIQIDDGPPLEMDVISVVVANGQFFGGGMWVAPEADVQDGLFDIVIIGDLSKAEVLANIHKLYNGSLRHHPRVSCRRGKSVRLSATVDTLIDADGELAGKLPARFEVLPAAIRLLGLPQNVNKIKEES